MEENEEIGLQIAPLLDVLFVLLLFFMVCAGAQKKESELRIKLPVQTSAATASVTVSAARIDIQTDGRVYLNQKLVENASAQKLLNLQAQLEEEVRRSAHTPVILVPSPKAPYERMIRVLDACKAANVKNVRFGAPL
jgi:biopolymer transport protein ExbD